MGFLCDSFVVSPIRNDSVLLFPVLARQVFLVLAPELLVLHFWLTGSSGPPYLFLYRAVCCVGMIGVLALLRRADSYFFQTEWRGIFGNMGIGHGYPCE